MWGGHSYVFNSFIKYIRYTVYRMRIDTSLVIPTFTSINIGAPEPWLYYGTGIMAVWVILFCTWIDIPSVSDLILDDICSWMYWLNLSRIKSVTYLWRSHSLKNKPWHLLSWSNIITKVGDQNITLRERHTLYSKHIINQRKFMSFWILVTGLF